VPCTDWLPFGIRADDALDDARVPEVPAPPPNTGSSEPSPDLALSTRLRRFAARLRDRVHTYTPA
jgi:hypothetical protein